MGEARATTVVMRIRVVTWNLQGSKLQAVPAVAAELDGFDADIVCLQEVQRRQFRQLQSRVGAFGRWTFKHWPVRIPSEGLALATRAPILQHHHVAISRRAPWWSWRRRVVQSCMLQFDGVRVRVANTHLGAGVGDEERARQARRIVSVIRDLDIVAGDMNVDPDSRVLAEFVGLRDAWAIANPGLRSPNTNWAPGPRVAGPVQRLDYVLVAPNWRVIDVQIPTDWERWAPLSDHLPVIVDLERTVQIDDP